MSAPLGLSEFALLMVFITLLILWRSWIHQRHWQDLLIEGNEEARANDRLIVFIARGGGLGLLPKAPGTWGSIGGVAWTAMLLTPGNFWFFLTGTLMGLAASVWICGRAEQLLGCKDPGEIVLDEITAVPVCFAGLIGTLHFSSAGLPLLTDLATQPSAWAWLAVGFLFFRVFDIWKPSPIRQIQNLPGGWGVSLDDVLAAVYVGIVLQVVWVLR